jgi:type VI protein secretion system component Hcp
MSQRSDEKPAAQPEPVPTSNQPTLTELSLEELAAVNGGTKIAKSSPVLMQSCATGVHLKEATITH